MEKIECDICVIGGGSGGLSVAAGAVQMGASVVLLEHGKMGGDCLNYGCVPSKALIAAGRRAHAMTGANRYGVANMEPQVDFGAVKDHVFGVIDAIAPVDSQERFEGLGVRVIRETGHFISDSELEAGDFRIKARRFVIATGSSPFVPPIPGLGDVEYYTNETIFELRERPSHLIVVGGGPIGVELAQAHRRLGSEVTVIEGVRALGKDDPDFAAIVLDQLRAEGVEIIEGAQAERVSRSDDGIVVHLPEGRDVHGSHLLMAVGRRANVDSLDADKAGIDTNRAGIVVDDRLRSSNRRVYAVGDVAGRMQFTHVAGYHAGIVIRQTLFGLPAKAKQDHIPWVTYSDPELAQIGLTEDQARTEHGDRVEIARFDFAENDRAQTERATVGRIKVMVVKGRPVGVSIVGKNAGELISLWSLVIANGMKMSAVAGMVAPYPTISEINKRVAGAYFSPRLFDNPTVKRVVGLVQKVLP
ncbi:dihydrolipoyl dehydrogenase family protein [Qingshengfaniella alkalisoli]|uniref:Dihydrolipoamide dehydrogenase n=1 Tax=Qingshengfaniella alkalisoli TaxID=2599296 RepID=A0A5B8I7M5_9RHOB|nr:FAD-dependent oxidoreductase [Qingshengfaniella alkalisoli]QDY69845.1 dihydrolipoamide dehydrogenase [Qingshengfaniella alkalisoli]